MKKSLLLVSAALAVVMTLTQCGQNPSKKAIGEVEALIREAKADKDNLTCERLEALNDRITEKMDSINADELSDADKLKCFGMAMEWAGLYMEVGSKDIEKMVNESMQELEQAFDADMME